MCVVLVGAVLLCVALAVLAVLCGYCAPKCARWQLLAEPACVDEQVAHALRCQGAYVPFSRLAMHGKQWLGVWSVSGRMRLPRPARLAAWLARVGGVVGLLAWKQGWQV